MGRAKREHCVSESSQPVSSVGPPDASNTRRAQLCGYFGPALLLALLAYIYAPVLADLFKELWADSNSSHGLLVPLIVAFLVWRRRKRLGEIEKRTHRAALLMVLAGAMLLPIAAASEVKSLSALSLLIVLGGLVWHIWGSKVMQELSFAYGFLFFIIPWPGLLVETLTFPLQLTSTKMATTIIGLLGIQVEREGVNIQIYNYTFAVAAPCSGIRSLAALSALGALYAYLLKGSFGRRMLLFLLVPPLALIGNSIRIVITLLLAARWGPEMAKNFYHSFFGFAVFLITFLLLMAAARLLGMKQIREDF